MEEQRLTLPSNLGHDELRNFVLKQLNVGNEGNKKVIKVRRQDECLVPISYLLHGADREK